ncbi:MAG: OmpA family protein [Sandaracinaceae bacterium]|nr:OmpA family protein [Sandaracinaceae bacterium]
MNRSPRPWFACVLVVGCSAGHPLPGAMHPEHSGLDRAAVSGPEIARWLNDNPTALAAKARPKTEGVVPPAAVAEPEPPDPEPIMKKAVEALEAGDLATAEKLAQQVIALDPQGYPYAWVVLGDVALAAHAWEKALGHYQKAHALDPDDGWTVQRIAQVLVKLGRLVEARDALRTFTDERDADADTWDALAWLELDLGDPKRAEAAFLKALEQSDDQDVEALYGLAMIHARRGDALAVEKDLRALFALAPERRLVIERDPTFFRVRIHPKVAALFTGKLMAEAKLAAGKSKAEKVTDGLADPAGEVVRFDFDSAKIKPESKGVLDRIAQALLARADLEFVRISGHADRRGDEAYNVKLSQARADAVRVALVARGVSGAVLSAKGYGVYCPLDDGDGEDAFARNRRVQFVLGAGGKVLGDELTCVERMKKWLKPDAAVRIAGEK